MKNEKKEPFYVGIQDPSEFRRQVLSSCKSAIIILKEFEIQREHRKQKAELLSDLSKKLKEINYLSNKLSALMPKFGLRALPKKHAEAAPSVRSPRKSTVKSKQASQLDQLEQELESIESKMRFISDE